MQRAQNSTFPVDDARLVHLALPESGWSGDRPRLTGRNIEDLRGLIRRPLLEGREPEFGRFLQQIFAHAVAAEKIWRRSRLESGSSTLSAICQASDRRDRKPKLTTVIREELRLLREYCEGIDRSAPGGDRNSLSRLLTGANPATRQVIDLVMLEHGEDLRVSDFYGFNSDSSIDLAVLGMSINEAFERVVAFVGTSVGEPALQQMARGLASLYMQITGERPGRSYRELGSAREGQKDGETGAFLDLCRHMATLVNQALPTELRRERPADMAKAARRAKDELKEEQSFVGDWA